MPPRMKKQNYRTGPKKKPKVSKTIKNYVHKAIENEVETKRFDTTLGSHNTTTTGVVYQLSAIPTGTLQYQRVGLTVRPKKYEMRFFFYNNTSADDSAIRLIFFQYKKVKVDSGTVSSVPEPKDILQDSNPGLATDYLSGINIQNSDAIHVISDKTYSVVGNSTGAEAKQSRVLIYNFPERKLLKKLQFTDAVAPIGSGSNQLYVLVISESANNVYFFSSHLSFIDA